MVLVMYQNIRHFKKLRDSIIYTYTIEGAKRWKKVNKLLWEHFSLHLRF
jgi:uncharacterized protein involved in tellurium resistance